MSSDTYKLRLVIDDSKIREIERRLNNLGGTGRSSIFTPRQSKSNGLMSMLGKSIGGIFGKKKGGDNPMTKGLLKIGLIAGGVVSIVAIIKQLTSIIIESSPMLQAILKLFNSAVLFIFRPIGDFIGFFLRPMIIHFLRNIAIPLYRKMGPLLRVLGSDKGERAVDAFKNPTWGKSIAGVLEGVTFGGTIGGILGGKSDQLEDKHNDFVNIQESIDGFVESLYNMFPKAHGDGGEAGDSPEQAQVKNMWFDLDLTLGGITSGLQWFWDTISPIFTMITDGFSNFWNFISPIFGWISAGLNSVWESVANIFMTISSAFGGIAKTGWDAIVSAGDFFVELSSTIMNVLAPAWKALEGFINGIMEFFRGIVEFLGIGPKPQPQAGGGGRGGAGGKVEVKIENVVLNGIQDVGNSFSSGLDYIAKSIQRSVAGAGL